MAKTMLEAEDFFVIRTPRMPVNKMLNLPPDVSGTRQAISEWLQNPLVLEALYLASPSLMGQIDVWKKDPTTKHGKKIEKALVKYLIRMATRPTPFGLFAGIHTGRIGDTTAFEVGDMTDDTRVTRLDMFYLTTVREHVAKQHARNGKLKFRANTSHYFIADECRYIEPYRSGQSWQYRLSAVECNEYFDTILSHAKDGQCFDALADRFLEKYPEADREEVEDYLEQLVAESILVADLSMPLTGQSTGHIFLKSLKGIDEKEFVDSLENAQDRLQELDRRNAASPEDYKSIHAKLNQLPVKAEENRLFQGDLQKHFRTCSLHGGEVSRLLEQLSLLKALGHPDRNPFTDFISKFNARYEGRLVRLDKLLDEESGISFSTETGYETPILAGLKLVAPQGSGAAVPPTVSVLDRMITEAISAPENREKAAIELTSRELRETLRGSDPEALMPASFGALVSLFTDENANPVYKFNGAYGPSAAIYPGRFSHLDDGLLQGIRDHLLREENHSPDVIFAEIAHMPEGRVGNVIARPHLRNHEITFMADSSLEDAYQIPVSDLYVWVEGGYVKLWSKRLKKQIVPRLSCAHNYSNRSLSAYKFLCMTQRQYGLPPVFNLPASQADAAFVPRVMLDNLILSEKLWRIPAEDLKAVLVGDAVDLMKLKALQDRYQLDNHVAFAAGDNVLYLDLRNPLMLEVLLAEAKGRKRLELKEVLFQQFKAPVTSAKGESFNNEIVIPIFNEKALPHQTLMENPQAHIDAPYLKRYFAPGSEWLSLKIYSGNTTTEDILAQLLLPAIEANSALFEKWFFIRYSDPDWHLRLRFKGDPACLYGQLLPTLNGLLEPLVENGNIHKIEVFTYEREVERYGGPACMELAESLFMEDSYLAAKAMPLIAERGETLRWRVPLLATDTLLSLFNYTDQEKLSLLTSLRTGFGKEFNETVDIRKQLGKKYRDAEQTIQDDLTKFAAPARPDMPEPQRALFALLDEWRLKAQEHTKAILALYGTQPGPTCSRDRLLASLLHMHNNRMFKAYGRQQEFVMHDFLRRTYYSKSQRESKRQKR